MDGEAWQATIHGVAKSRTRLSDFTITINSMNQEANCINAEGGVRKEESGQRAISFLQMRNDKDRRGLATSWKKWNA